MDESGTGILLDIPKVLSEAQHRWLKPVEICEILRNYRRFNISPEAPKKPASGCVFLFDRKALRYFRKDGHNWRKKKDGKTVKEAHEKLKVGSIDMLHCYYAHGEDNENFQRRSYWLLENDLTHIVFVHYLEVQGNKASIAYLRNNDGVALNSGNGISVSSSYRGTSPTSPLSSAHEDNESECNHHASSEYHPFPESPLANDYQYVQSSFHSPPLDTGNQSFYGVSHGPLLEDEQDKNFNRASCMSGSSWTSVSENSITGKTTHKQVSASMLPAGDNWQGLSSLFPDISLPSVENGMGQYPSYHDQKAQYANLEFLSSGGDAGMQSLENGMDDTGNENLSFILKKPQLVGLQSEEGLKKVDSFSRWMANELGEADELAIQPSSGISWSVNDYESNMPVHLQVDTDSMSPSISQDQLYSIIDFLPQWAYSNQETKVLIAGIFLDSGVELSESRWSVMFGQVEVPAEVLADGTLCCRAPLHSPGLLPFYVTCSNRLACSQLREFEYRANVDSSSRSIDGNEGVTARMNLYQRFEMVLQLEPNGGPPSSTVDNFDVRAVSMRVMSLREGDNSIEEKLSSEKDPLCLGELHLEKKLKTMFFSWFLTRVAENGKGLTDFDEAGQSVLHLAAALDFSWAFQPFIEAGVSVDFRDKNGWTALHWTAFYGREDAVAALLSLGAGPGLLTDPSAEYPLSRTPADLASANGHKGISGFLAETSLTSHLSSLKVNVDGADADTEVKGYQTLSERVASPTVAQDASDKLSIKDTLAAVCNATQAAARIHQIFRIQSFQRKQLCEQDSSDLLDLDNQAVSLVAGKASRFSNAHGTANAAAVRIQKKYRGWKKRKEFLLLRQKVVKIQAHVRGHQVRKKYKSFAWSVGIVEKVILRWRRKRSGLRGFQPNQPESSTKQLSLPSPEDTYDVLKQGRRQTEERMQKALDRVRSMAQYPEARAQYRRLLAAAEGFRESKEASDEMIPDDIGYLEDDFMEEANLWDDETFLSRTFQ